MFSENLARIRTRIQQACQRRGRDPSSVTLVCVTKGISVEMIRQVIALGVTDVGENRVQEARQKQHVLGLRQFRIADFGFRIESRQEQSAIHNSQSAIGSVRWHLVGHLQRNKAKDAVDLFDVIHSLDSVALAEELERQAAKRVQGKSLEPLEVFIQVNVSGEATKFGCTADGTPALASAVMKLPHLRLVGLMTIAPFLSDPEHTRPHFRRLRELRDKLVASLNLEPRTLNLSMGMSQDFEVAIEEGADVVRIGTAIFQDQRPETRD